MSGDLTSVEAWNHLQGAIVDAAAESACWPIINWLQAAIIQSGPNTHPELLFPDPLAPLPDKLLLQNRHWLPLSHLPGLDPSINHSAVTCIEKTVAEVVVELRETRIKNKRVRYKKENKGAADYFGANLAHLINLVHVTDTKDLPPVWEALAQSTKHQKLLVL